MKILLLTLFVVVIIAIALPTLNTIMYKQDITYRGKNLRAWYGGVRLFIQKNNRVPNSLNEVYRDKVKEGDADSFVASLGTRIFKKDIKNIPDDPNQFEEGVGCGLLSGRDGWIVRELRYGEIIYPGMLMIDQDGNIYRVQKISNDD